MNRPLACSSLVLFLAAACTPVEYEDHWMESPSTRDPLFDDPSILLSTRTLQPTEEQKATPVIVAVHGFSSSTWEWSDFAPYAEERGVLVSRVLLGGHGRSLDEWIETDRFDWARPIVDEYRALTELGYTDVSIAASSTGVTLYLQELVAGSFDDLPSPKRLILASPLIVSFDKRIYIAPIIGPVLNNIPVGCTEWEHERFYCNWVHQVMPTMLDLLNSTAGQLDGDGIRLPEGTTAHVFYAERERTIDEEGITKLENGLTGDNELEIIRMDSPWHSWMRSSGRPRTADEAKEEDADGNPLVWTDDDDAFTLEQFDRMLALVE